MKGIPGLKLPWSKGIKLLCTASYGPTNGSPYHDDKHNAYHALDFDRPWEGNIMPQTRILSVSDGMIERLGTNPRHKFGYFVTVNHGEGYRSLYAHLRDMPKITGKIKQGQVLGYLGESGQAAGPHLHFQFSFRGKCLSTARESLPEPISGFTNLIPGIWYSSDNREV